MIDRRVDLSVLIENKDREDPGEQCGQSHISEENRRHALLRRTKDLNQHNGALPKRKEAKFAAASSFLLMPGAALVW